MATSAEARTTVWRIGELAEDLRRKGVNLILTVDSEDEEAIAMVERAAAVAGVPLTRVKK